jgi:hypothetical protein
LSINSFSLNILLKKKKIKKKKKKNLYVYKINRFSLLINNFIHKNTKNVKKIRKIKYKVFIKKIKSKVLFNFKTNKILYKTIIKKDKIFKKIKFLKKNFCKTKSLNNVKVDNYSFFKKIKKYNNNNNSILYSLIDNFKHNINYNYNNIKKFSIFDYLFLNSKNLEKYYLNFYLLTLPNENKKISNLSIKNHFIDFYINNKLDSNSNSVNTDNKYSQDYIKSVFNDIKVEPKDVYNNTEYNLFKKENICFFFNFKGGRLTTFRGARKVH